MCFHRWKISISIHPLEEVLLATF